MSLSREQRTALRHRLADECALVMMPNPDGWNNKVKTPEQKQEIIDRAQTLQTGIRLTYHEKKCHAMLVIRKALGWGNFGEIVDPDKAAINWAVSYSGGGDSTVLSHLMESMGAKVRHVGSNTRMEYPETVRQWKVWAAWLEERGIEFSMVFPDVRPKELWKKIGVPLLSKQLGYKFRKFASHGEGRMSEAVPADFRDTFHKLKAAGLKITDQCCDELKKKPLKKWAKENKVGGFFTGVRAGESMLRRMTWIRFGSMYESTYHGKKWICNPLSFWTKEDIDRYIQENKIEFHRPKTIRGGSGCVACMFGCHLAAAEGSPNALQQLAIANPKLHQVALDEWGYREVLDLLEIPYE